MIRIYTIMILMLPFLVAAQLDLEPQQFWVDQNNNVVFTQAAVENIKEHHDYCLQQGIWCEESLKMADTLLLYLSQEIDIMEQVALSHIAMRDSIRVTLQAYAASEALYNIEKNRLEQEVLKQKIKVGKWKLRSLLLGMVVIVESTIIYVQNK